MGHEIMVGTKRLVFIVVVGFLLSGFTAVKAQGQSENLFYYVDTEDFFENFKSNNDYISIVAPQTYFIFPIGVLWGEVGSRVIDIAEEKNIDGIPFYSNYWFADYNECQGGFVNGRGASYKKVIGLAERYDAELIWLDEQQCYYALRNHDSMHL
ncbi:hypothetical protein [Fodinibius sp. Rm-B-1B1-1]|uniref:hypothetical protein n=1 Tax=Fodinibius alkaliphilus TaxID=3140241 RepID=UPI00315A5AE3